jgi:hypothetical protein
MANRFSTYTQKFGVEYLNNQVIISSDRITLHSKTDSVFLFGKSSVSLSSIGTVNVDSPSAVILDSPKILLGSHTAAENLILGTRYMKYFSDFLNSMIVLCTNLETVAAGNRKSNSELGKAMLKLSIFASSLSNECALLKNKLNSALSQTSYTS